MSKKSVNLFVISLLILLLLSVFLYYFLYHGKKREPSLIPYALAPQESVCVVEWKDMSNWNSFYISNFPSTSDSTNLLSRFIDLYYNRNLKELASQESLFFSLSSWSSSQSLTLFLPTTPLLESLFEEFIDSQGLNIAAKKFLYREEMIEIYPLKTGDFLSSYLVDNVRVINYKMSEIERVIDAHLDGASLLELSDFKELQKQVVENSSGSVYINNSKLPWGRSAKLMTNALGWSRLELDVDRYELNAKDILKNGLANLELSPSKSPVLSALMPYDGFALYHWSDEDLNSAYSELGANVQNSEDDLDWSLTFAEYIINIARNGVYGVRTQDSVSSSELILRIPLVDSKESEQLLNQLVRKHELSINKLLREETIQGYWGAYTVPTTELFCNLANCSRDKRVIYMQFLGDELILCWNYSLLMDNLQDLKGDEVRMGRVWANLPDEAYYTKETLFYADLASVVNDSIIQYLELPTPFLDYAEYLSGFTLLSASEVVDDKRVFELILKKKY